MMTDEEKWKLFKYGWGNYDKYKTFLIQYVKCFYQQIYPDKVIDNDSYVTSKKTFINLLPISKEPSDLIKFTTVFDKARMEHAMWVIDCKMIFLPKSSLKERQILIKNIIGSASIFLLSSPPKFWRERYGFRQNMKNFIIKDDDDRNEDDLECAKTLLELMK
jgi:hypothetical protein